MTRKIYATLRAHIKKIVRTTRSLGPFGMVVFVISSTIFTLSALGIMYIVNNRIMVEVPTHGGTYTEGIIGTPRFINPLLAISGADRDLSKLVYIGLLKPSPDGTLIPALAKSYEISPDGNEYTVHIRNDARFQDNTPVTAEDVLFTISSAKNPALKSPLFADWQDVTVSATDSYTVHFILTKPSQKFIENLTLGILPKHLWKTFAINEFQDSPLNEQPIGAGPYQITSIPSNKSSLPVSYHLSSFKNYILGEPYIKNIIINCYAGEDALVTALNNGAVMGGGGMSTENLSKIKSLNVVGVPLNRIFGVFFNPNNNVALRDSRVRSALNIAVNKQDMIETIFNGYAEKLDGPIPSKMLGAGMVETPTPLIQTGEEMINIAHKQLLATGWLENADGVLQKTVGSGKSAQVQTLSINISTGNTPEMTSVANFLKQTWTSLGIEVAVSIYEPGDLSENAIQPRKYEALVSGEIIGRNLDLFPFWHSSQRNDPGLNIAMYSNPSVDTLLTKIHKTPDDERAVAWYNATEQQITADVPAIFLYSSDYAYVLPKDVRGTTFGVIENPSDRFGTIDHWYMHTDHVWPIFVQHTKD